MDADDQIGHFDKRVMCFSVSLSSLAGGTMETSKPMNEKQARGRNERPEPVLRPEGQISNAGDSNVAPTGKPIPEVAEEWEVKI